MKTLSERFWSKVNKQGPTMPHMKTCCWTWLGCTALGYGQIWLDGKMKRAHRVAWFLIFGKYPEPYGLHHCDNSLCVRPSHVYEGTLLDNGADRTRSGHSCQGSKNTLAKLTEAKVVLIRELYTAGKGTQRALAKRFGVSQRAVLFLLQRKTWRHV